MTYTQDNVAIEMIGVEKNFCGQKVLNGIQLSITEGKTTVITGASGQGKSVILKHMLGLIHPDRGNVRVFGQDINLIGKKQRQNLRGSFGVLFQSVALFDSMTVYDNVALPLRERSRLGEAAIRANVEEKLALMDLHDVNHKYPTQLSGGMKKRVGLARALMLDPRVVFFDEPTTGLDVHRSNEIYRLFHHTQKELGYTAVIVSHDVPRIFKLADYVALLADGKIQGCLSPNEFQRAENPHIKAFVETTMGPIYMSEQEEHSVHASI
ncbi:MAG: ATP-binding cassette domain-containing protein [Thiogranum sp.]|nr:ATP-binding cassette domain-containing protein [Thiogranum sp.]